MKVNKANLLIDHISDTTIGDINEGLFNALIGIFNTILIGVINIITYDVGINLNSALNLIGIKFFKFGKTTLEPHD